MLLRCDVSLALSFWKILNAVLFLLIGFEVMVISLNANLVGLALVCILMVTVVRWIAVSIPIALLRPTKRYVDGIVPVMTWAGLRGGISVALVLALPDHPQESTLLAVCYAVVIFSIVVQGLTIERVIRRKVPPMDEPV